MGALRHLLTVCCTILFAASSDTQEPTYAEFRRAFNEAREVGDQDAIDRAIRLAPNGALVHFTFLCRDQRNDPRDRVAQIQQLMKAAWRRLYGVDTVMANYQSFYANQPPEVLEELSEAELTLRRSHLLLSSAKDSWTRRDFELARDSFLDAARIYARLGDQLHTAQAWQAIVYICDQMPEQTREDREDMVEALEQFLDRREAWNWTADAVYQQSSLFLQEQRSQIRGELAVERRDLLFEPDVEELVFDLEFAALDELEADMFALGGPVPVLWPQVRLLGESYEQLPIFKEADLFLRRQGSRFWVSAGTATSDDATRIRANSNPRTSEFYLDEHETPYAMWFFVGSQNERFMSADLDLSPSSDVAMVHYRSAASWTTAIDREQVTFYDDNCDGRLFNPDPFSSGLALRTLGEVSVAGTPVPAYDSMRIGRNQRVPYSEVARIGGVWYSLRGVEDGKKLGLRRLDPRRLDIGKVRLDWKHTEKATPEVMVIQGTGRFAGAAFDISSGNPIDVPVGKYEIGFGRIVVGRGRQRQMALIFKGDSKTFAIEKGATFELEMGAPFSLDYEREGTDTDVVIDSTKIRVLGRSGAVYSNLHNAVPSPRVLYSRNADGSNARRIGQFRAVHDAETANKFAQHVPLLSIEAIAFPLPQDELLSGSPVMRFRVPSNVVVGLQQDVHPLFEKLLPVWKEYDVRGELKPGRLSHHLALQIAQAAKAAQAAGAGEVGACWPRCRIQERLDRAAGLLEK